MNARVDATAQCCAECRVEGAASLKICKACMLVKYCNAECQHKHWPKHKIECKLRAAKIYDEALFKDPPPKEDCPICFLPMPIQLISCVSLPPATRSSVPIYDFAMANQVLVKKAMEKYYSCCGKSICAGCIHSLCESENIGKCPFCNSERMGKTEEEMVVELMKRVEVHDPASIYVLANYYHLGRAGFQQDQAKAIELFTKSADLGCSKAHYQLGVVYRDGGDLKKAKFHFEAAAMAGHDAARCILGCKEFNSGNMERAIKQLRIAASAGDCNAMQVLMSSFEKGSVSRESIYSTLAAYNNSCAELRSEARDACILAARGGRYLN